MRNETIAEMEAEAVKLEAEAAQLEAKVSSLRAVLALYKSTNTGALPDQTAPSSRPETVNAHPYSISQSPRRATTVEIVRAVARELAAKADVPVPTMKIVEELKTRGMEIGGNVPQNVVSSILSRTPDLRSNGRMGWTLNENGTAEAAPDTGGAATPSSDTLDLNEITG